MDDYEVAQALNTFVRNVTSDDVSVEFEAGIATINGRVASAQARRAIEDLVAAHEGVRYVVNNLAVASEATVRGTPAG